MSWFDLQTQPARTLAPTSTGAFAGGSWVNPANAPYTPGQPGSYQLGAPNDPNVAQPNLSGNGGTLADGLGTDTLLSPWTQDFAPRDPNQIADDPAYKFQTEQGLQGVQRSAAAKGTLLTGGTLKALDAYGQGLASTYNDKYYGRDLNEYLMRQNTFYQNQDRPFTKLSSLAQLGKPSTAV